jgi:hypothetical protein
VNSFVRVGMGGYIVEEAVSGSKIKFCGIRLVGGELTNSSKDRKV